MNRHLRILLLAIAAITANGCKTDISGVTSSNGVADAANDISVGFYTIDDQGHLNPEYDKTSKRQLPTKSDRELRIDSQYVGLTVEAARAQARYQGLELRVLEEGDVRLSDWHPHRITVCVKNGIVQSALLDDRELSLEDYYVQ